MPGFIEFSKIRLFPGTFVLVSVRFLKFLSTGSYFCSKIFDKIYIEILIFILFIISCPNTVIEFVLIKDVHHSIAHQWCRNLLN